MTTATVVLALLTASPKAGDLAPDFAATDTDGNVHTLSEMVKKGRVILAFFVRSDTPG